MCGNLVTSVCWKSAFWTKPNLARTFVTLWFASTRITLLASSGSAYLGSPQRSAAPTHLRTLALLGANPWVSFFNFSGDRSTKLRRYPRAGTGRQPASTGEDVRPCILGLFVDGGGDGAQRVRTHNPTSFPPKFAARSGSLRWKAMASKAGETVGLLSGSCSPQAALGGECANREPP